MKTLQTFRFDLALRYGLARAGMTQSDLARRLGISRQAVSLWMKSKSTSITRVEQVSQALGIPMKKFIDLGKPE
ncbi:MAG: helix-turn-helix transcriptional regulator [bacterium]